MIDKLINKFEDKEYLADLFHVLHFDELNAPAFREGEPLRLLVPACLDRLVLQPNDDSEAVLRALVVWARPDTRSLAAPALDRLINAIRTRYVALRHADYVTSIDDVLDPDIEKILEELLPSNPGANVGVMEKMKSTARAAIGTTLTVSRRFSKAILMRGRSLSKFLRDHVTQLEIPAKAREIRARKAALGRKLDPYTGGSDTRFYIGLALDVAGLIVSGVPGATIGISGLALAMVDP